MPKYIPIENYTDYEKALFTCESCGALVPFGEFEKHNNFHVLLAAGQNPPS